MPLEPLAEAAVQVVAEGAVQVAGEIGSDVVKRRFGWQGCVVVLLGLVALGVGLYFLLA